MMFWFTYPMEAARLSLEAQRLIMLSFLGLPSGEQRRDGGTSNEEVAPSVETPPPARERRESDVSDGEKVASVKIPEAAGPLPAASRPKTARARKASGLKKSRRKGTARKKR